MVNIIGISEKLNEPNGLMCFQDTCYRLAKISQNQQLLDILACNYGALGKKAFCQILKRWFIS